MPFFVIAKDENQMVSGIPYLAASYLRNPNDKHTVEKLRS